MSDLDLCWKVEAACAAAWPAESSTKHNGWLFNCTEGTASRRINSVNPTKYHTSADAKLVDAAVTHYSELNKDTIFRIPEMISEIEPLLDQSGFGEADTRTLTLLASDIADFEWHNDVTITAQPKENWLDFALDRSHFSPQHRVPFRQALLGIGYPVLFGMIEEDEVPTAIAYVVIVENIAIIESVETKPQFRRQGRAARLVGSLLAKSRSLGATKAALQVIAENDGAISLYKKLGFSTELYAYHYRKLELS